MGRSRSRLRRSGEPDEDSESGDDIRRGEPDGEFDKLGRNDDVVYDGVGRRVAKAGPVESLKYVYDSAVAGSAYLTGDHLGTTRLVTDSSGSVVKHYDPLRYVDDDGRGAKSAITSALAKRALNNARRRPGG